MRANRGVNDVPTTDSSYHRNPSRLTNSSAGLKMETRAVIDAVKTEKNVFQWLEEGLLTTRIRGLPKGSY